MNIGIALLSLVAGLMVGTGAAVGMLGMWSGRRAGAARLVAFGLASLLGSMAVLALLFWLTPTATWGMALLGVMLGLWLAWLLVRGYLSRAP